MEEGEGDGTTAGSIQAGQESADIGDVAEDLADVDDCEVVPELYGLLGDNKRAAEESGVHAEDEALLDALAVARVAGEGTQGLEAFRSIAVVTGGRDGPLPLAAPPSLLVLNGDGDATPRRAASPSAGAFDVAPLRDTPSPTRPPPPSFDTDLEEDAVHFLLSASQGGTQPEHSDDRWKAPLMLSERVPAGGTPSKSCTFLNPSDAHWPLTLKAMQWTNDVFVADPSPSGMRRSRRHAQTLRNDEEVVIQIGMIPIRRMDIMYLLPGELLTDQAMNGFIEVLKAAFPLPGERGGAEGQQQLYLFGSYFYSLKMSHGYIHDACEAVDRSR